MFESVGEIKFDPRGRTSYIPNWAIVTCSEDLRRYYSWFVKKEKFQTVQPPAWGAHISFIRGEKPKNPELWKSCDRKKVKFYFSGELGTDGDYWWLKVYCDELLDIREALGLPRHPYYKLHMSLGKIISFV